MTGLQLTQHPYFVVQNLLVPGSKQGFFLCITMQLSGGGLG